MKSWVMVATIGGFLWVTFCAMAGHHLQGEPFVMWFEKAQRFHIVHVLALLWLSSQVMTTIKKWVAFFWVFGVLFFSGSLYLLSIGAPTILRFATPIGGIAFLIGWAMLIYATWQGSCKMHTAYKK